MRYRSITLRIKNYKLGHTVAKILLVVLSLISTARISFAQSPPPEFTDVVEQVAAVVGDSVILMTEIDAYLLRLQSQGWTRPETTAELMEFKGEVLDLLINEQLLLQDAALDSTIIIDEEELEQLVQQEIDGQVRQFGTLSALQNALAEQSMTMSVFREQRRTAMRRQMLQERYMAKKGRDARRLYIPESEIRDFFEENKEQLPTLPPTVKFLNLQLQPEPSDSAKATALAKADSILQLVVDGSEGDFEELAKRYSDGPSSKDGGELGWVRRDGSMVEKFEEVAFALPAGVVSIPVETEFGYHLILVDRIRGGERRISHILIQPEITDKDISYNLERANKFKERLLAGEDMSNLSDESVDTLDLTIPQISQISTEHASSLRNAKPGDILGPLSFDDIQSENLIGLVKVLELKDGGKPTFEEMKGQIENRLKSDKITENVVKDLRDNAFIEIRLVTGAR
tara:strand:+ start:8369 stop:9742 length:1374 start_codon:yes stop_codon:yes gene_type:complete